MRQYSIVDPENYCHIIATFLDTMPRNVAVKRAYKVASGALVHVRDEFTGTVHIYRTKLEELKTPSETQRARGIKRKARVRKVETQRKKE
mmetsp:Transcript_17045/g.22070  ORF Transcript_17045/g.22070 Transcript_17045/m.22070 type:complete len:90 (+) Transcript_17045:960-1229(+)